MTKTENARHDARSEHRRPPRHLLSQWAPITTRLLGKGGDSAWNILDGVMGSEDHQNKLSFVECLNQELETSGLVKGLLPARTTGDVRLAELMSILETTTSSRQVSQSLETKPEHNQSTAAPTDISASQSPSRGDQNLFIDRKHRSSPNFAVDHPCLFRLIKTVEETVSFHLTSVMEFDLNLTSVQLAEYPGDNKSGYPRHCDRGPSCREEATLTTGKAQRLITAVYYLTPSDWHARDDGGCLRIHTNNSDEHWDLAPYSDRLVLFRSDGVEHEVLPSKRRTRRALTIWLYGTLRKQDDDSVDLTPIEMDVPVESAQRDENAQTSASRTDSMTEGPPPLPIPNEISTADQQSTIFVSIAAYRDSETGPTLRSLMESARFPERIFVGLVLQVDTMGADDYNDKREILDRLPSQEPWYKSRVRVLTLDARHSTGPCPARAMCQTLVQDEDYVLQIDAHMRFRPNWDVYLLQQLALCPSDKPMLTTYPVGYQLPDKIPKNETRGTLLVPWKFDDDGMMRQKAQLFVETPQVPVLCHWYSANFNFARSAVVRDCPYDGSLHHLFFGEEPSMAVRLYCAGYDLYAPCESVCYHLWSRSHRPRPLMLSHKDSVVRQRLRKNSLEAVRNQLVSGCCYQGETRTRSANDFESTVAVCFRTRRLLIDATRSPAVELVRTEPSSTHVSAMGTFEERLEGLATNPKRLILEYALSRQLDKE